MDTYMMDRTEYKFAMKLIYISSNTNVETYGLFLTPLERHELAKACVDVRNFFDWNFKFQDFYEVLTTYHYPPLEFLWNLKVLQVMPLEAYILNIYSEKEMLQKFIESVLRLFTQDFEENDVQYLIQTGFLSYFVNKSFPVMDVMDYDERIKEICLEIIRYWLQDVFSTKKEEIKAKRFSCFFSLWNAGILEEASLLYFCLFALDSYLNLLPAVNDLDAFDILENSCTNMPPYHLLAVVEKLLKILKMDGISCILTSAVQKSQINAASLLVVVKAFLKTHREASVFISKLVSELMNEAYEKFSHKILLRSLLIGYQAAYQPNISPYIHYRLWLQTIFRECGHSKNRHSFSLLIQVLSDIVPFHKSIDCIKVAIESNFSVPPEAQTMYADYIILLKTRIQDLKPSSKPEETVGKVLSMFEHLGKIPPVVMETSLLQKHEFLIEFLPALLIPRVVPPVPDVREKFIEALDKAGKIPANILQKYRNECMLKQNKIIEDINMIDENFDDFLNEDSD